MIVDRPEETLVGLLRRAKDEIALLVRAELEDARREIAGKVKRMGVGVATVAVGLIFGLLAVIALTVALIFGLSTVVAPWAAAAIVTGVYAAIALACALSGRSILAKALPPIPTNSLKHMKEDARWIIKRASSAKS